MLWGVEKENGVVSSVAGCNSQLPTLIPIVWTRYAKKKFTIGTTAKFTRHSQIAKYR